MFQREGSQVGDFPVLGLGGPTQASDFPVELDLTERGQDKTRGETDQETDDHDPVDGDPEVGLAEEIDELPELNVEELSSGSEEVK